MTPRLLRPARVLRRWVSDFLRESPERSVLNSTMVRWRWDEDVGLKLFIWLRVRNIHLFTLLQSDEGFLVPRLHADLAADAALLRFHIDDVDAGDFYLVHLLDNLLNLAGGRGVINHKRVGVKSRQGGCLFGDERRFY